MALWSYVLSLLLLLQALFPGASIEIHDRVHTLSSHSQQPALLEVDASAEAGDHRRSRHRTRDRLAKRIRHGMATLRKSVRLEAGEFDDDGEDDEEGGAEAVRFDTEDPARLAAEVSGMEDEGEDEDDDEDEDDEEDDDEDDDDDDFDDDYDDEDEEEDEDEEAERRGRSMHRHRHPSLVEAHTSSYAGSKGKSREEASATPSATTKGGYIDSPKAAEISKRLGDIANTLLALSNAPAEAAAPGGPAANTLAAAYLVTASAKTNIGTNSADGKGVAKVPPLPQAPSLSQVASSATLGAEQARPPLVESVRQTPAAPQAMMINPLSSLPAAVTAEAAEAARLPTAVLPGVSVLNAAQPGKAPRFMSGLTSRAEVPQALSAATVGQTQTRAQQQQQRQMEQLMGGVGSEGGGEVAGGDGGGSGGEDFLDDASSPLARDDKEIEDAITKQAEKLRYASRDYPKDLLVDNGSLASGSLALGLASTKLDGLEREFHAIAGQDDS